MSIRNIFCYIEYTNKILSDPFLSFKNIDKSFEIFLENMYNIKYTKRQIYSEIIENIKKISLKYLYNLENIENTTKYQYFYECMIKEINDLRIRDNIKREKDLLLFSLKNFLQEFNINITEHNEIELEYLHIFEDGSKKYKKFTGYLEDNFLICKDSGISFNIFDTRGDFYYILKIYKLYLHCRYI